MENVVIGFAVLGAVSGAVLGKWICEYWFVSRSPGRKSYAQRLYENNSTNKVALAEAIINSKDTGQSVDSLIEPVREDPDILGE